MEPHHEEHLRRNVADADDKVVRIWEYAAESTEGIEDPVGEELETFRETRDLLYECIESWLDELLEST